MNLFQLLTLPAILLVLLWDLYRLCGPRAGRRAIRLCRMLIWAVAAAAIISPGFTSALAHGLGIGRGTDLVLYGLCFLFLLSSSYWYARTSLMERQITELTRSWALRDAEFGDQAASRSGATPS
jgi:hypothetical protein